MFLYFKTVVVDISRDYDDDSNHDNDIDNYGGGDCKLPARKPSPKRRVAAKAANSGKLSWQMLDVGMSARPPKRQTCNVCRRHVGDVSLDMSATWCKNVSPRVPT